MYKRILEEKISLWLEKEEIIIITGSRQVGKSTLLKQIQSKISQKNIFYNLEDFELLNLFDEIPKNLIKLIQEKYFFDEKKDEKIFVFIDEIQYLKNPTNFLKYIFDEYKDKIKLIVSGSSAFYIDEKFHDSLAGRKKIFHMPLLTFEEFLIFKDEEILSKKLKDFTNLTSISQNKIYEYLDEFLTFGAYPKIVLEKNFEIKKELIGELINSYIKKDLLESKIELIDKFFNLYKILANQTGSLLNSNELSNTLDLSITAINKYLGVLKKTFHMYELKPYFKNIRKELTKMPKFYIQDLGIKNYFEKNFNKISNRIDKGAIFETFIFHELKNIYSLENMNFWRTQDKKEIDFLIETEKQKYAFEVKYKNQKVSFENFLSNYPNFQAKVISRENFFEILK